MTLHPATTARDLAAELEPLSLNDRLILASSRFPKAVFTTSLGLEDQAITGAISESGAAIRIVTLQTGRLFPETLELIDQTKKRLSVEIEEFHPARSVVDDYVGRYGFNGFYDSIEARHACCHIRKIEPLGRAIAGADAWITGLRREQSANRSDVPFAEWSSQHGLMKLNLLADWPLARLNAMIEDNGIPVNALHAQGYPSIGCAPCTRAIKAGEPERAGRWWWEQEQSRECGLHPDKAPPNPGKPAPMVPARPTVNFTGEIRHG